MPSPSSSSSATNVSPSGVQQINTLIEGTKWGDIVGSGVTLTYSFPFVSGTATFNGPSAHDSYSSLNEPLATYRYGLNTTQQTAAKSALQSWANVADIRLQEVADTSSNVGDIRFTWTSVYNGQQTWGWAYAPNSYIPSGGDIWISTTNKDTDWTVGSSNFSSLIHETGHALGFKHPFEGSPVLPSSQDSVQYSVMSYTEHPHGLFRKIIKSSDGSYSMSTYNIEPDTPMLYDIAAAQYIYGPNLSYRTGNDVYTFDPATPFFRTIWDAGGTDTISVSNFTRGCIIDLRQGYFSKISIESDPIPAGVTFSGSLTLPTYDGTDNLAIAFGAVIENAIGGRGNDILTGNDSNNSLTGGPGNDTLSGGNGIDTAVYSGNRATYSVSKTTSGLTVSGGSDGTDSLSGIERLRFGDINLALDLSGGAGNSAKLLGAVFGSSGVANKSYAGIGISLLDGGMTYIDLATLAINASGAKTPQQIVNLLWTNVVGSAPAPEQAQPIIDMLASGMSVGQLGVLAADTALNQQKINLVGLAQSGIEYIELQIA